MNATKGPRAEKTDKFIEKLKNRFNLEINAYNYVHFTYEVVVRMLWNDYCYQLEQMLFK